jgi:hypothetical protein
MTQVRHHEDRDHIFTGSEGRWTICGKPWGPQPKEGPWCQECVSAVVKYADKMRQGRR